MQNPWQKIGAQYIHPADAPYILQFNQQTRQKTRTYQDQIVQDSLPPLPFIGDPWTAPVIVLGKNTSFDDIDTQDADRHYPALNHANLLSLTGENPHPFFYLDPAFADTNGYTWWNRQLNNILTDSTAQGVERETVLGRIAWIQQHAYRTKKAWCPVDPLPTQAYTFHLVREAVKRGAVIVMLYGAPTWQWWQEAVPEIPVTALRCSTPRNAILSKTTFGEEGYARILAALTQKDGDAAPE